MGGRGGFVTGVFPVQNGYLVMVRQPLYSERSTEATSAQQQHDQLVRVLADAGLAVVRARRTLAARRRTEFRTTPVIPKERPSSRAKAQTLASV